MDLLIIIFGALIAVAGIGMMVRPDFIFDFLRRESNNYKLHIFAIVFRLIIGILLIFYSDMSRYPVAIEALGWFAVIAAIVLILIGRDSFRRLIDWAVTFLKPYCFVGGLLAVFLGGFLMYTFW